MSIEGPDRDLEALTELYYVFDLPGRGVTFEQFMDDPRRYLENMAGRVTLHPGAQAVGSATDDDSNGWRSQAQPAVVVDLRAMRERRQAKLRQAATPGEDDHGLDYWIED